MEICVKDIVEHLPSPLTKEDGTKIHTEEEWKEQREKIKKLLIENVYGPMPEMTDNITVLSKTEEVSCMDGKALESVYTLTADKIFNEFQFGLRIVRPVTDKPVPVLFAVFGSSSEEGYTNMHTQAVIDHGYALAMVDREKAVPNIPNADIQIWIDRELHHDEYEYYNIYKRRDLKYPDSDLPIEEYMKNYSYAFHYGKIAIGAHCVRLAVSFVLGLGFADPKALAVTGHSRDGKVSLCAGVFDERLGVIAPHGSGCGGLALYNVPAKGVERIDDMIRMWPSWLPALARFKDAQESKMPVDMHYARACVAPRAVFNAEGTTDFWAGPFSSYVGKCASQEVFDFLGASSNNGMCMHRGGHDLTHEDMQNTLAFCDQVFYGKKADCDYNAFQYFDYCED